ncbi:MAG TPA: class I SAM-dependent methyltransferase [Chroococcales cyanobacterium]
MIGRIKGNQNNSPQIRRHQDLVDFIKEADVNFDARVLDVGCGSGGLARLMQTSGFRDIHGVDWSDPAVVAQDALSSYRQMDLNEQVLEETIDSKFDLIVCSETLEHLERPAKVLRSMRRLLNDTGSIYVTVPNCANLFQRISWLTTGNSYRYRTERPGEFGHISLFPSNVMTTLLNRAGLKCVREGKGYAAVAGFITDKGIKLGNLWSYASYYQLKPIQ